MSNYGRLKEGAVAGRVCTMCDGKLGRYDTHWIHATTHRILCEECWQDVKRQHDAMWAGHPVTELAP